MARSNKISMPSSGAGLTRYFEDFKSKFRFQPGHVIVFVIIVLIIELILHNYGYALFNIQ
jgi:preprotein translocase subunit Sec61beta